MKSESIILRRPCLILGHLLFWLVCAWLQFPRSYWDDSLIIGPAIGIVDGYGLRSLYLSRQFYPAGLYLFYPPTFFWVLAGWIAAFGRGVASLSLFWAACGFGISVPAGALLARVSRGVAGHAIAPILIFGCIAYTGFRYEVLALATLFSGTALCIAHRRLAGYLLLCLTPTIAPSMAGSSIVAIGALVWHGRGDRPWREVGRVALALGIALSWLCVSVSGHVAGLIETMYRYRGVRIGLGAREMEGGVLLFVVEVNLLTAVVARFVLKRGWGDTPMQLPLLLIAAWLLTVATHARPTVLIALNVASVAVCLVVLAGSVSRTATAVALGAFGLMLAWLNIGYVATMAIRPLWPAAIDRARAIAAGAGPEQTIVADARVMREALHLPGGRRIEDSMVRHAWPDIYQDNHRIPQNELWIVTSFTLMDGSRIPLVRGLLDALFLSPGMKAVPGDAVCRLDAATSRRWRSYDPADLIALACR